MNIHHAEELLARSAQARLGLDAVLQTSDGTTL